MKDAAGIPAISRPVLSGRSPVRERGEATVPRAQAHGDAMDKASIGGVLLAVVGIVAGLLFEGGNLGQILQPTAAMIVFGGTFGAVLLQFPLATVAAAFRGLVHVFATPKKQNDALVQMLVAFANKARRQGIVSLDADLNSIDDPFLKRSLTLAVDGTEPGDLRKIMRVSLDSAMESEEQLPMVFESAGGFSPTVGILGAVLGLIQVMQHLDNLQEVGRGIAVAFVATIYGVGAANLFFLPFAGKMRIRIRESQQRREMMLEGVSSILEGMNPRMIEVKLAGYLDDSRREKKERAA
jgi:chemotaxis protein MotA